MAYDLVTYTIVTYIQLATVNFIVSAITTIVICVNINTVFTVLLQFG